MSDNSIIVLPVLFFLIALLYSSVGFGGGSSYLAILAIFLPDFIEVKTIALLCNVIVVSGSAYLFWKHGLFEKKRFIPMIICSVPAAFLGAMIQLDQQIFFVVLGAVLALSGVLLVLQWMINKNQTVTSSIHSPVLNVSLATGAGFLSGLVGIGGGILLSPVLNIIRWDGPKKIAALASFFILANSIAGLAGLAAGGILKADIKLLLLLAATVFIGGQTGARLGIKLLHPEVVKALTGVLVIYIGIKLILKHSLHIQI